MYTQEIRINLDVLEEESPYDELYHYLSLLRKAGQVIGKEWPIMKGQNSLVAVVMTLEEDSLDDKHSCKYTLARKKVLGNSIAIRLLGNRIESESNLCTCDKSSSYVLYTDYLRVGSPLNCGDCLGEVPLYRLKQEEGYSDILSWESNYIACDTLQMNCTVGEVFGTKQLSDLDSSLTKVGLEICQKIESFSKIPTYYYLYNYSDISLEKDKERKCPSCQSDWLLEEPIHGIFDFKCNDCKLLSNLTHNS